MKNEFTIPMKVNFTPFKRCEECSKKKLNVSFYQIHDNGLNEYIEAHICKKCLREAINRLENIRELT